LGVSRRGEFDNTIFIDSNYRNKYLALSPPWALTYLPYHGGHRFVLAAPCCRCCYRAFLGKGSSKTPQKYVYQKSMSKTFYNKINKKIPDFYCVSQCFSAKGVQNRYQQKIQKKMRRKLFAKKSTKIPKPISSIFYHVFARFSARGVRQHRLKNIGTNIWPRHFFGLWPIYTCPTTGVLDLFRRPLASRLATAAARGSYPHL
jgi:hypothetical protein